MVSKGFTLIELMIVIAIVGILATIALPAYTGYLIKARVTKGLQMANPALLAVAEVIQATNIYPISRLVTFYTSPAATANIASIVIGAAGTGVVIITYTAAVGGGGDNS